MIQDKDYTLRLIRQFSQALEKLILGKPEESLMQKEMDYDSLIKDIFKMDFKALSSLDLDQIDDLVKERQEKDHKDYYEMLGNLYYYEGHQQKNPEMLRISKVFYQNYLTSSQIYSMPIINRITELNQMD